MSKYDFFDESDPHRDKPFLFLGGSSFLGLEIAQTLYYFYDIYCTYNSSSAPAFYPEFLWKRIDFTNSKTSKRELKRVITKSRSKFLVNFVEIDEFENLKKSLDISKSKNIKLAKLIVDTCKDLEVFPIFISSDHVFCGIEGPYDEKSEPNPSKNSLYGQIKYNIEQTVQTNLNDYAILRLSTVLGSNQHFQKESMYRRITESLKQEIPIQGGINKFRSPTHIFNVAFFLNRLIDEVIENSLTQNIFHIPGEYMSEYKMLTAIANSLNLSESEISHLIVPAEIISSNQSQPLNLGLTSDRTTKLVNARYLTFEEGLHVLKNNKNVNF